MGQKSTSTGKLRFAAVTTLFCLAGLLVDCQSIPEGKTGAPAEALAQKMLSAANLDTWNEEVRAVEFRFRESNSYFWDKQRGLVEFRSDDLRVLFSKNTFQGIAFEDGERLQGDELKEAILKANSNFVNDAFWLQPAFHIRSPGTKLYAVNDSTLRVTFSSGGVTPGDTYVFHLDENGKIQLMEMWVSIIPIEGADASFHDYSVHEPGVAVARSREVLGFLTIVIDQVKMHTDAKASNERFAPLFEAYPDLR